MKWLPDGRAGLPRSQLPCHNQEAREAGRCSGIDSSRNSPPKQQLEITRPQGCSCCLQRRTAAARPASAKPACPAPDALAPMERVTGCCEAMAEGPTLPHHSKRKQQQCFSVHTFVFQIPTSASDGPYFNHPCNLNDQGIEFLAFQPIWYRQAS